MANNKVLIIGGGIAGLCVGVYLRKSGWETEILEMHSTAGGLATAWKRHGYTFENCVHWLVGSREGADMNALWKEVFDIGRLEIYNDEIFETLEAGADRLVIYRDPDRLEHELLTKAPEDEKVIKEFVGLIRKLSKFEMPGGDSFFARPVSFAKMIPFLPVLAKYSKRTMADFGGKFKNPLLREFFAGGLKELSLIAIAMSLAWMAKGNAGYPIGGSLRLIGLIEENYRKLGGAIRYRAKVERILVKDGRAAGVVLDHGEEIAADIVVSAADGHATIFEMLGGRFLSEKIKSAYESYKMFPSYLQVSFGVAADLRGEPGALNLALNGELKIDPETKEMNLAFRIFHFDPTFAPTGKTAVVCFIGTYNHEYWVSLRAKDRAEYEEEKARIARRVMDVFERRFPATMGKIEVVDVATPATIIRYTGNWKGSMEGWLMTPSTGIKQLPDTLPGLKNFYMVGQWISPGGGLPSGLLTGRTVSRKICRDHGRKWTASAS